MKSATVVVRACGFAALGLLATAAQVLAQAEAQGQGGQGNGQVAGIPTLGGVGIVALAGALSIGGAWLLSRNRDKQQ